jgi:hypothetical protein
MVEIYPNAQSDNGTLTAGASLSSQSCFMRERLDEHLCGWPQVTTARALLQGMAPHKDPRAPLSLDTWMRNAGFTNIQKTLVQLPMSGWSRGM